MSRARDVADIAGIAVPDTILDAKGDLIAASGADTPARLAPGSNGQMLMVDSSATTGLRYVDPPQRNLLVNGAFDIWQRGTSTAQTAVSNTYTVDRWFTTLNQRTSGTLTTRQNTTDKQTGENFCVEIDATGVVTTAVINLTQILESRNVIPLRGKTVTLSFSAKVSTGTANVNSQLVWGTNTDAFPSGGDEVATAHPANTSWQRFTASLSVPTNATSLAVRLTTPSGFAAKLFFSQVQLETGPVATPFEFEPYEATLRKCQRYYQRIKSLRSCGITYTTSAAMFGVDTTGEMRTAPTVIPPSVLTNAIDLPGTGAATPTAVQRYGDGTTSGLIILATGMSGLTVGRAAVWQGSDIELSAEL